MQGLKYLLHLGEKPGTCLLRNVEGRQAAVLFRISHEGRGSEEKSSLKGDGGWMVRTSNIKLLFAISHSLP